LHNNLILIQYWHSQVHRSSPMSAPDLRRKQGCWRRYRRRGVERTLCTQWNQSSDRMQLLLSPTQEENSSETSWICCGSNFTSNGEIIIVVHSLLWNSSATMRDRLRHILSMVIRGGALQSCRLSQCEPDQCER